MNETEIKEIRKKAVTKIKLACGIPDKEKVLKLLSLKASELIAVFTYQRQDGKLFSKGDAARLSFDGNRAKAFGEKIEYTMKL